MFERSYLENIIRNAPIGIITTDLERRITFMSHLARTVCPCPDPGTGTRIEELVTRPEVMQNNLARVLFGKDQRRTFEAEIGLASGTRVVEFTSSLLRDDAYVPIGLLIMCEDVTETRETERKYGALMANSRDPVIIFQGDQILEANEAFARSVGRTHEACEGIAWSDFVHADALPMLLDFIRRRAAGDDSVPHTFDIVGLTATGEERLYSVAISPVFPDRRIDSMILRDITERRQLEERIADAKKLESLALLAGGIAHDFNNLLSGAMGYASLLKTKLDPSSPTYRYADKIEASATQAKELTAQLLAFARGGQYELRPVNLNQIVLEAVRMLRLSMPRTITLSTRLTSQLKWIQADPTQMHQIITNLFTNAVEAMPSGGRITIRTQNASLGRSGLAKDHHLDPGPYVHLTVSDTGRGIPEEALAKVVEPFYSTKGVGHGLGLSAVYGIARNHHGTVTIESEPGQGTTVHIYIPASPAPQPAEPHVPGPVVKGRETILVVDDEAIIRDLLQRLLDELGYRVILACDGEQALDIFRRRADSIDCVLLDMVLPTMDGAEVYAAMRELRPDVRVILCTGYALKDPIDDMLRQGVAGVLRKPFQVEELSGALRSVLDRPLPANQR
jgi:two-component system cell cycle sensor histidine kinase/response regulator CckA